MVDLSTIESFLASLKAASTISRELIDLVSSKDASEKISEINAKILEAQGLALRTQADQFTLSKKVSELEEELENLKDFRREKQKYELTAVGDTAFVYASKPVIDSGESTPHWLCSTCCDQNRKSILQFQNRDILTIRLDVWKCHVCQAEIRVRGGTHPQVHQAG